MAKYKATWFFKDRNTLQGWSESLITDQGDPNDALTLAKELGQLRVNMCGFGIILPYTRISDEAIKGDSKVDNTAMVSVEFKVNDADNIADEPWQSLLVRMESGIVNRKFSFIRGIPDAAVLSTEPPLFDARFLARFQAWRTKILNANWQFPGYTRPPATPLLNITNVTWANGVATITTTATLHALTGDLVQLSGIKTSNFKLTGTYQVIQTDLDNLLSIKINFPAGDPGYLRGGKAFKKTRAYFTISNVQAMKITTRKPGRPFGLVVGRRAPVRRLV